MGKMLVRLKCSFVFAVLFALSILFSPQNVLGEDLRFVTHNAEEFTFIDEQGHLRGNAHGGRRAFGVEVVHEMRKRLGLLGPTEVLPFKRAWRRFQEGHNMVFYNVNRTPKRENLAQWIGPLQETTTHFFTSVRNPTPIAMKSDLANVESICVVRGNVHDETLTSWGLTNLIRVNNYDSCAAMLVNGRTNLTVFADSSNLLNPFKYGNLLEPTELIFSKSAGYIAAPTHASLDLTKSLQSALDDIKADGTFDVLYEKYYLSAQQME